MVLRIGLVGYGVVGGGVVNMLKAHPEIKFVIISMRDTSKARDVAVPEGCEITTDSIKVINHPDVDVVVEVMGGVTLAKEIVFGAIKNGKHVVTANKALIAKYMDELVALLAEHPQVEFQCEAAVCGGIPIINTLQRSYAADKINSLKGIMNGTTNFILTKMNSEKRTYQDVLAEATALGYAEADPSADVEGWDARCKLCILAKLAWGRTIEEERVFCRGITQLTQKDFKFAKTINRQIKHLGVANLKESKTNPSSSSVNVFLSPCLIASSHPISSVSLATNAVSVVSKFMGDSLYIGPGAGRYPTANSVVSDILQLLGGASGRSAFPVPYTMQSSTTEVGETSPVVTSSLGQTSDFESEFYIRCEVKDRVGVVAELSTLLAKEGMSIKSVLQLPSEEGQENNGQDVSLAFILKKTKMSLVADVVERIWADREKTAVSEAPFFLPYIE